MNWGSPEFVLAIIALSTGGWIFNNWIRARHGYALEDEWFGKTEKTDPAAARHQTQAHAKLLERVEYLEKRTAALEAIVTDSGYDLARQIEALSALDTARSPAATPAPASRAR
ncbi:hypothetical protein [Novosphingobium decolorationis]|uniref:Uncharacterized protein n=1 Tax=Novosphingobium decolorationis TaxID=2698673 RepID=A0ABX8E7Q2_9SPHN|nr:hypothetical protein [Novosphingobium decolorationis]MED5543997.1 hypothetical protein [Pseudomonadota bacterium]QVM84096.1 hypothetical protein HT578_10710 [Novosphingobium decolorationis]